MDRIIRIDPKNKVNKFELALEHIADGIYITDKETKTIYVNRAYERISGTDRCEFLGKSIYQVVDENLINESGTIKVIESNESISMNQILSNGKTAFITSTPILNKSNEIEYIVTIVRDMTEIIELRNQILEKDTEIDNLKNGCKTTIIHNSKEMSLILKKLRKVAKYDTTIFITGETGVGKGVIAKEIHKNSLRADEKFVQINCSTIPANLLESELFGYKKGSFTGALSSGKIGIFEEAHKGTLFLDEISELPLDMQPKLLTAIQEGKIRPIGSNEEIDIDVRIIVATNKDMHEMVRSNKFREDLFYRLNVIPIHIEALRDRKDDIIPLALFFLKKLENKYKRDIEVEKKVFKVFYDYGWPGNVRELENLMERLFVMCEESVIKMIDLPDDMIDGKLRNFDEIMTIDEANALVESSLIIKSFEKMGNVKDSARLLGISSATFVRKRQKYKELGYI